VEVLVGVGVFVLVGVGVVVGEGARLKTNGRYVSVLITWAYVVIVKADKTRTPVTLMMTNFLNSRFLKSTRSSFIFSEA